MRQCIQPEDAAGGNVVRQTARRCVGGEARRDCCDQVCLQLGRCRWRPSICQETKKPQTFFVPPPNLMSACFQEAIDRGRFRDMADNGAPQMDRILETGLEVAHGMAYLHQHDIVHGDLVRPCPGDSRLMCRILVSAACSGVP